MSFWNWWSAPPPAPDLLATKDKLDETLEMLEKKENVYMKKIEEETAKAAELVKQKKRRDAIRCLKVKKMYENQIDTITNFQLRIQDQIIQLESAKATAQVVLAMKQAADAIRREIRDANIEDVDKIMDDIADANYDMKVVQERLGQRNDDFDEDELMAELEELDDEEGEKQEELPSVPTHSAGVPARPSGAKIRNPDKARNDAKEAKELAELQAEF